MAHKYTVQESNNLAIGQGPSMLINDLTQDCTPRTGTVFVAIQVINDAQFDQLEAEDNTMYFGTDGVDNGHTGGVGDRVDNTMTFPAGTVIYGRWDKIDLANGIVIAYMGG